jgi:hypothetical protein
MVGKFNEALDWAKKSLALFKEQTSDEKDSNVALLTLYEQVITSVYKPTTNLTCNLERNNTLFAIFLLLLANYTNKN